MKVKEAIAHFPQAANCIVHRGKSYRSDNWTSTAHLLRHYGPDADIVEAEGNLLTVTPPAVEPPAVQRQPFVLIAQQ